MSDLKEGIFRIIRQSMSMDEIIAYKTFFLFPHLFTEEEIPEKVKLLNRRIKEYEQQKSK